RAARNVHGTVILYADSITDSMRLAIDETIRRRRLQAAFNKEHGITPQTVIKSLGSPLVKIYEADYVDVPLVAEEGIKYKSEELPRLIQRLKKEMKKAAENLEFEKAAELRDRIRTMQEQEIGLRDPLSARGPDF
ncbi:MAG TPA: UvrB/UvrC motif-containing protein, partial [Candidatus Binatia bacterium]|nr:UvrB/UvrC motif-containing protein [Candidatus Binatia bacterium]